jgi:hypothetical protein
LPRRVRRQTTPSGEAINGDDLPLSAAIIGREGHERARRDDDDRRAAG